ncbi:hypothetical protein F4820DRAFT_26879 [Hypoxylon rubiginosum]|uniref:Uncharacterized protein n=1 Tax=Hypoxylon rubiginosum TaxID=110542 RepID=A0ACB9YSA8_9PEZI|nr:hypothetical protein F4820DRAFT_26879 [Hypoxylon rubiginosum]
MSYVLCLMSYVLCLTCSRAGILACFFFYVSPTQFFFRLPAAPRDALPVFFNWTMTREARDISQATHLFFPKQEALRHRGGSGFEAQ